MRSALVIREYRSADWDAVWAILAPVFRAGETYAVARDIDGEQARRLWTSRPKHTFVACDETSGAVLGTYYVAPNYAGPGGHIANCGYVVAEEARGRGVAAQMCEHSQDVAVAAGFVSMQYNLVASTNVRAVALWQRMGFAIIGTIPGGFAHPERGLVDAFVMFKRLVAPT